MRPALLRLLVLLLLAVCVTALLAGGEISPRAAKLHRQAIVIDTHMDTPQRLLDDDFDLGARNAYGHIDIPRMREGGLDAAFFAAYVEPRRYSGANGIKRVLQLIDTVYEQVARHPAQLTLARTAADIRRAHAQGKIALLLGVEGGHAIDDDLRVLRNYAQLGVRYMTLTHSLNNNWADSATDTPAHNGLTDFGKEVVREMNRLGMVIDVSHVSEKTFFDVLEVTQAPIMASHSSCRALVDIPRNLSDAQLRAVAKNGGVVQVAVGCWFVEPRYEAAAAAVRPEYAERRRALREQFKDDPRQLTIEMHKLGIELQSRLPRGTLANIADHIDHVVQVAGINHVGLGSDFDGVSCLPEGLDDVSGLPGLTQLLLERGYRERDIKKILGGNTLRVLEEAERAAARLRPK